ncbi:MAG: rod shape-determining protein RodA [Bacillota bacterium]|jgi:rod shape determining protein RodA
MTMFNSGKLIKNIDWVFVAMIFATLAINLIILSSASANVVDGDPFYHVKKQLLWIGVGTVVFFMVALFNYDNFKKLDIFIYGLTILLLITVLFAPEQKGAHRWFDLGFMDFQPSELAKIAMIVVFGCFLAKNQGRMHQPRKLIAGALLMLFPIFLIIAEPDLGTSLVFVAIILSMALIGGVPKKTLLVIVLIIAVMVVMIFAVLYFYTDGYQFKLEESPAFLPLKPYQLTRLIIFINPYMDPLDTGYHMIQSEVAIGSGGFLGKGFGNGTQVQGNFLPEHHTDFIFSVVGEEFGFLGALGILMLYLVLLLRAISIANRAKDLLGSVIVGGVVGMFAFQIFVNVGMTIGIMPVTGVPLPLLSYGGSSMLINMAALGLILSVGMRSNVKMF